ncbi:B3 domain-containing protein Os03g0120900-like isoform X2 [Hordeum vulgare subsp. vulgare]|uniref:TF-B3 domain-containing protein n=1 Tax=Hordeum vulgare subsp. vulgare TaxID=112509 RepID=A0A8I6X9J6_HORVV|nr:B3 domain-containing protein Os03g0120900-like isoform X2 [Hordeum vulgare subsp. vulgare]
MQFPSLTSRVGVHMTWRTRRQVEGNKEGALSAFDRAGEAAVILPRPLRPSLPPNHHPSTRSSPRAMNMGGDRSAGFPGEEDEGRPRPRFFKVLVGDFARRLEIPRDFLGHIPEMGLGGSNVPAAPPVKATLKRSEGKTWAVELEKVDRGVFLTTGWPKFVVENALREYEFLLFGYDKKMHFMVSVFGRNACEKAVRSSGIGAQATTSLERKLPCDIFLTCKRGYTGDELMKTTNNPRRSHSLVMTPDQSDTKIVPVRGSTQGNVHIPSQSFADIHLHEVDGLKDELKTYLLSKVPMDDDKAKAIAEVMRRLHVDRVTVDLFCATLCLYKWNSDAAAEVFNTCRGKPQIQNQFLKQKLVLQFDFIKRELRHFFPTGDDCSPQTHDSRKNSLVVPNVSTQPQQYYLPAVKSKLVDDHELCDLLYKQKRRIVKWRPQRISETPRRSPRLAHLKNSCGSTESALKEKPEVLESSLSSTTDRVEDRTGQAHLLYEKPDRVSKGDNQHAIGSLSLDFKRLKKTLCESVLSEKPQHHQENEEKIDQGNNGEIFEEQVDRNAAETSESFMGRDCIDSSPPTKSEVSSMRINELCLTWKPSVHTNSFENVLLHIQCNNFTKTITHVQGIIRGSPSDLHCSAIIEAVVQKEILKWDSCLQDVDAQRVVIALLEHAKKIKEIHNFNMESRKEEFSTKLQDQLKWQLKELEGVCTSLEFDYKKATCDSNIAVSTSQEQKKKLQALQYEIKGLQQSMMMEDEIQKLVRQVAEHESLVQKSLMERVRVKTVLKSYAQILVEVKERLASNELGLIDVDALVKIEMDNLRKEIEISKGRLLNIIFK